MKEIIYSLLLGLEQGLTEFLPISSSGHLTVTQYFLDDKFKGGLYFDLVLHIATLLAVIIFFRSEIINILRMVKTPFKKESKLLQNLVFGTIITVIFVLFFQNQIENIFDPKNLKLVAFAFIFTGVVNITSQIFIKKHFESTRKGGILDSIFIGFMQGVASIPGISRSGSTIMAGVVSGNSPDYAFSFSFLLSIPVIIGAFLYETVKGAGAATDLSIFSYAAGFVIAFISGYFALKLLKKIIRSKNYYLFGVYTMVIGILILVLG